MGNTLAEVAYAETMGDGICSYFSKQASSEPLSPHIPFPHSGDLPHLDLPATSPKPVSYTMSTTASRLQHAHQC